MIAVMANNRRLMLAGLLTLLVAMTFWLGSRYPSLDEKAMMGGDIQLEALGFDTVVEVRESDSFLYRAYGTTVNWIDTNKKGMTFGLILAACLMTVLSLIKRRGFENVFANSALGALIGAPLGVCVNCVVPIARGMHASGTRLETTLATMLASPTLNVIVLTMVVSLLPWYLALTKIALTVLFILVAIPLISHIGARFGLMTAAISLSNVPQSGGLPWQTADDDPNADNSWFAAVIWLARTFVRHLWFIVRMTVPLMLAAGVLGAVVVTALPWNYVTGALPDAASPWGLIAMVGVAAFGLFLPVPIAFDVIVVVILVTAGLPTSYAMVLLFTLGIFSVYSFSIIWSSISRLASVIMLAALGLVGLASGYVAQSIESWDTGRQRDFIGQVLAITMPSAATSGATLVTTRSAEVMRALEADAITFEPVSVKTPPGISIEMSAFGPVSGMSGTSLFTRTDGTTLGFQNGVRFTLLKLMPPFQYGRGISTGDVHNDGWTDVLIAEDTTLGGLSLYTNVAGKKFIRQAIDIPLLSRLEVINAALVDLNDDGWLDIALSAHREGNFVIYNERGEFLANNLRPLPKGREAMAAAISFGDLDRDGDLDMVLGNWTMGALRNPHPWSRNLILRQENGEFRRETLDELYGETLASIVSDFDNDGNLDVIFGNDFSSAPDIFYSGDGQGGLTEITAADDVVPHSTTTTMSIATGDLNNDLVPETYLAQIAFGSGEGFSRQEIPNVEVCDDLSDAGEQAECRGQMDTVTAAQKIRSQGNVLACAELGRTDPRLLRECVLVNLARMARRSDGAELCKAIPASEEVFGYICGAITTEKAEYDAKRKRRAVPQIKFRNVLLVNKGDGTFEDHAQEAGFGVTGWSWNAKFADVDNDGLKDLYVANGRFKARRKESNYFFRNEGNLRFSDRTAEYGLKDYRATSAYSYVDFDNDGDLDIISLPVSGQIRVFVNNTRDANSIAVSLRDKVGNRFGIGSKVVIRYGGGSRSQQMVELQAGGGFMSFDAATAHFGLGTETEIEEIEVRWSTGEQSMLRGPFRAGAHYIVRREH